MHENLRPQLYNPKPKLYQEMGVISLSSASVQEKGPVCPDDLNKSDYTLFIYILQSYRQTIKVNATVFVVIKITKNLHSYNPLGEIKKAIIL